jgi:dipeptidyl aminopeptidase/acylaminoacyl peptidase
MKRILFAMILMAGVVAGLPAQTDTVQAPENLVVDGAPPIPIAVAETAARYGNYRTALLRDWNPVKRQMLISTRFGDTAQLHVVNMPGGERQQLTFFPDSIAGARFHPLRGDYIVFMKDTGGSEWYQLYRYDIATRDIALLTDGKSRNLLEVWSSSGNQLAYMSTRRNGKDTDLWVMDPSNPKTDRMLVKLDGGGWDALDWSPDDKQILLQEGISINESYYWLVDTATGQKRALTARDTKEKISYGNARFSKDGKGIYLTTDKDSEFQRLEYMNLATKETKVLSGGIPWDVSRFDLSNDGKMIAFVTNEDGIGKLHLLDTASGKEKAVPKLPVGLIEDIQWHRNGRDLGLVLNSARAQADCYSLDIANGKIERWTMSESAVDTADFPEAELVHWKSFDGKMISGFLYRPPAKFSGKRPVLINIHGGPEGQWHPGFLGRLNYFLNGKGIAVIFPNVRGSTGYGKTFSLLDNGYLREDTYKDINALFDWIGTRSDLDSERVALEGGSYGGHMVLAVSTLYGDRIRCSIDIVGISNLVTFLEHTEAYRRDLRRVEYGDERDPKMREFLERIAPMNNTEKIRKPMLVVAGKNDPRVPVSESDQIVAALKKQRTPVWYLMARDEGHGFKKKQNVDFQFNTEIMFLDNFLLE